MGKNASGKSSIINALLHFNEDKRRIPPEFKPLTREDQMTELVLIIEIKLEEISEYNKEFLSRFIEVKSEKTKKLVTISKKFFDKKVEYKINDKDIFFFIEEDNKKIKSLIHDLNNLGLTQFNPQSLDGSIRNKKFPSLNLVISNTRQELKKVTDKYPNSDKIDEFTKISTRIEKIMDNMLNYDKEISFFIPRFENFNYNQLGNLLDRIEYNTKAAQERKIIEYFFNALNLDIEKFEEYKNQNIKIQQFASQRDKSLELFLMQNWTQDQLKLEINFQDNHVDCYIIENKIHHKISHRSSGENWFLSFLIFLFNHIIKREDKYTVILMDEPLVNLHASAQKDVMQLIENFLKEMANLSVFLTTHSPFLIQQEKTHRVLKIIKNEELGSIVENLMSDEMSNLFSDLGIKPSDYLFYNGFIFVEGKTDIKFFNNLFETFILEKNISILKLQGKNNLRFVNSELIMKFISKGLKFLIILDKDENNRKLLKELPKAITKNTKLLPVREYENFYLNPEILVKYLNKYHTDKFTGINLSHYIQTLINNSIDDRIINETIIKTFLEKQPIKISPKQKSELLKLCETNYNNWFSKFIDYFQNVYHIIQINSKFYYEYYKQARNSVKKKLKDKEKWKYFPGKKVRTNLIKKLRDDRNIEIQFNKFTEFLKDDEFMKRELLDLVINHFNKN